MAFTEKYTTDAVIADKDKKVLISNDAFAVGEMLQELVNMMRKRKW